MTRARSAAPADQNAPAGPAVLAGAFLVAGAATLWATFGIFAKRLYAEGFQPVELASARAFVAFAAVLPIALLMRAPLRARPRDAAFLTVYGVVGFAVFEFVYLAALDVVPVSVGAALLYTAPAFVVLIARFTLGEPIERGRLAALALTLTGGLLVTGAARTFMGGSAGVSARGLWLGLAAGFTYAIYTVLSKHALTLTSPLPALTWSFGAATLVLWPFASPLSAIARGGSALPWLIGLGIVPTLLAYALFLRGLRVLRASAASMIAAVEPVVAALLAMLLLGERLKPEQGLGILCVVCAAIWTERRAVGRGGVEGAGGGVKRDVP